MDDGNGHGHGHGDHDGDRDGDVDHHRESDRIVLAIMTQTNRVSHASSNGSSGTESWISADTVRATPIFGTTRGTSMHIQTDKQKQSVASTTHETCAGPLTGACMSSHRFENDSQISPGSNTADASWPGAAVRPETLARRDSRLQRSGDPPAHPPRRDLPPRPSIEQLPPSGRRISPATIDPAPPTKWPSQSSQSSSMPPPSFAGSSFFDDSAESSPPSSAHPPPSPPAPPPPPRPPRSLGPIDAPTAAVAPFLDERRPSQASVTTISSQSSGRSVPSRRSHRKLQGFFGDEFPGRDAAFASETSLPIVGNGHATLTNGPGNGWSDRPALAHGRKRTNSMTNASFSDTRTASPTSRPHTPVPPSDVTPWLYQDSKVRASPSAASSWTNRRRDVPDVVRDARSSANVRGRRGVAGSTGRATIVLAV